MDEIDLQIIKILLINSRLAYREIAEKIGLSVGAVHKRVQSLVECGDIKNFIARPSFSALNAIVISIGGISKLHSYDRIIEALEEDPYTILFGLSTGNYVYLTSVLRSISEMHQVTQNLTDICKIDDPFIVIYNFPYQKVTGTLSKIDYQIIKSLNRNSRKPVSEIADETGLSSKTVSRHINDMITNNLVSFTIEIEPGKDNDIVVIFHSYISKHTDMKEVISKIIQTLSKDLLYVRTYSNLPLFLSVHVLVKTLNRIKYFEDILKEIGLIDIIPRIIHKCYYFKCWLDAF